MSTLQLALSIAVPVVVSGILGTISFYLSSIKVMPILNHRIESLEKDIKEYKSVTEKHIESIERSSAEKSDRLSVLEEEVKFLTVELAKLTHLYSKTSDSTAVALQDIQNTLTKITVEVSYIKKQNG